MKVTQTIESWDEDCRQSVTIKAGNKILSFIDGEPEDNTISRNFNDVLAITKLMVLAHTAGTKGEPLEIETIERDGAIDEDEDD